MAARALGFDETSRMVKAGDIRLHVNEAGEGPVLVMLHGGGPGASSWSNSWWAGLAADARAVVPTADLGAQVDSPAGRRSVAQGLSFPAVDLFVHAWDLGRSAGIEVDIPAEAAEFARGLLDAMPPEQLRSPGVFAPEVAVPPGAGATEAFLAWTGRDPRWTPPASPA